jgi:hypothetical protein
MNLSIKWIASLGVGAVAALMWQGCTVTTTNGPAACGNLGAACCTGSTCSSGLTCGSDGTCGTPAAQTDCNDCLVNICINQWSVCANDSDCLAIYQCATGSGANVTTCICNGGHSSQAEDEYLSLSACDTQYECSSCQSNCASISPTCPAPAVPNSATLCAGVDSGVDAPTLDATPTDCNTCVSASCATQAAACASGSDCDLYDQCLAGCSDATCSNACGTAHAPGQMAAQALASCTSTNCAAPCGL